MAKPFIAARIPQKLADKLDERVEELGQGKTDIIVNALAQYLGCSIDVPEETRAVDRLVTVEKELTELQDRVRALEKPTEKAQNPEVSGQQVISFEPSSVDNAVDNQTENDKFAESKESRPDISVDNNTDKQSKKEEKPIQEIVQDINNTIDKKLENILELSTPEILGLTGIGRNALNYRSKNGLLPFTENGYAVLERLGFGKTENGHRSNLWKVQKADDDSD